MDHIKSFYKLAGMTQHLIYKKERNSTLKFIGWSAAIYQTI
jgi:hypothetical protein